MVATTQLTIKTIVYFVNQISQVVITVLILTFNFLIPEFLEYLRMGAGKGFNPAKDIPSLAGKVILVTGGTYL